MSKQENKYEIIVGRRNGKGVECLRQLVLLHKIKIFPKANNISILTKDMQNCRGDSYERRIKK